MPQFYYLMASAAAGKDPPIIDLDSTVFIQLGIFIITALVLSRFLFRPYLQVRAARVAGIEGAKDEARRLDEEAQAQLADYQAALASARSKAQDERARIRSDASAREREVSEKARAATQAALAEARRKLEADATRTRKDLEPRAQEIARAIAQKILNREVA